MKLHNLPFEILLEILELLHAAHQSSLCSLASTNKHMYNLAKPFLFSHVTIHVVDGEKLQADINAWIALCRRRSTFDQIRSLHLTGSMIFTSYPEVSVQIHKSWEPFCKFLKLLPNLQDLHFGCYNLIPPCIVEELSQKRSRCRVHLGHLPIGNMDPHPYSQTRQFSIPQVLHSVTMEVKTMPPRLSETARSSIMRYIIQQSPNLRQCKIHYRYPTRVSYPAHEGDKCSRSRQIDCTRNSYSKQTSMGRLEISGHCPNVRQELEFWNQEIDFSLLHTLKLDIYRNSKQFPGQMDSIDGFNFLSANALPSLKALSLRLAHAYQKFALSDEYFQSVRNFLTSLKPLRTIEMTGCLDKSTFDTLIRQHGATLSNLILTPESIGHNTISIQEAEVRLIAYHCRKLQSLHVRIPHTRRRPKATPIFHILGSVRQLQHICLVLDLPSCDGACSRMHPHIYRPPEGPLCYIVVEECPDDCPDDGLDDETLPSEIFGAISASRITTGGFALESLLLSPVRQIADEHYYPCPLELVDDSTQMWIVERSVREDSRDHINARRFDLDHADKLWPYSTF